MTSGLEPSQLPLKTVEPEVAPDSEVAKRVASEPHHASFTLRPLPADEVDNGPGLARRFCRDLARGMVVVVLLHIFVLQISVVRGQSMMPSLLDGDRLVVDRISYAMTEVSRFDVVVLRNPRNNDVDYVKRVAGLPGDRVCLRNGHLTVNGKVVLEGFTHVSDADNTPELIVPEGSYFVLGDNRPISCDSREFGLVRHELLKGKVRVRFWPLSRVHIF